MLRSASRYSGALARGPTLRCALGTNDVSRAAGMSSSVRRRSSPEPATPVATKHESQPLTGAVEPPARSVRVVHCCFHMQCGCAQPRIENDAVPVCVVSL